MIYTLKKSPRWQTDFAQLILGGDNHKCAPVDILEADALPPLDTFSIQHEAPKEEIWVHPWDIAPVAIVPSGPVKITFDVCYNEEMLSKLPYSEYDTYEDQMGIIDPLTHSFRATGVEILKIAPDIMYVYWVDLETNFKFVACVQYSDWW